MNASMIGLKAALYEHKTAALAEAAECGFGDIDGLRVRKAKRLNTGRMAKNDNDSVGPSNRGVEDRVENDAQSIEKEMALKSSALERKASLYDSLINGGNPERGNIVPGVEDMCIDFLKKRYEQTVSNTTTLEDNRQTHSIPVIPSAIDPTGALMINMLAEEDESDRSLRHETVMAMEAATRANRLKAVSDKMQNEGYEELRKENMRNAIIEKELERRMKAHQEKIKRKKAKKGKDYKDSNRRKVDQAL